MVCPARPKAYTKLLSKTLQSSDVENFTNPHFSGSGVFFLPIIFLPKWRRSFWHKNVWQKKGSRRLRYFLRVIPCSFRPGLLLTTESLGLNAHLSIDVTGR